MGCKTRVWFAWVRRQRWSRARPGLAFAPTANTTATHLMPEEMTRLSVASTVSCTAAVQFMAPLLVT